MARGDNAKRQAELDQIKTELEQSVAQAEAQRALPSASAALPPASETIGGNAEVRRWAPKYGTDAKGSYLLSPKGVRYYFRGTGVPEPDPRTGLPGAKANGRKLSPEDFYNMREKWRGNLPRTNPQAPSTREGTPPATTSAPLGQPTTKAERDMQAMFDRAAASRAARQAAPLAPLTPGEPQVNYEAAEANLHIPFDQLPTKVPTKTTAAGVPIPGSGEFLPVQEAELQARQMEMNRLIRKATPPIDQARPRGKQARGVAGEIEGRQLAAEQAALEAQAQGAVGPALARSQPVDIAATQQALAEQGAPRQIFGYDNPNPTMGTAGEGGGAYVIRRPVPGAQGALAEPQAQFLNRDVRGPLGANIADRYGWTQAELGQMGGMAGAQQQLGGQPTLGEGATGAGMRGYDEVLAQQLAQAQGQGVGAQVPPAAIREMQARAAASAPNMGSLIDPVLGGSAQAAYAQQLALGPGQAPGPIPAAPAYQVAREIPYSPPPQSPMLQLGGGGGGRYSGPGPVPTGNGPFELPPSRGFGATPEGQGQLFGQFGAPSAARAAQAAEGAGAIPSLEGQLAMQFGGPAAEEALGTATKTAGKSSKLRSLLTSTGTKNLKAAELAAGEEGLSLVGKGKALAAGNLPMVASIVGPEVLKRILPSTGAAGDVRQVLSDAMSGAGAGSFLGPWGTLAGGVGGGLYGLADSIFDISGTGGPSDSDVKSTLNDVAATAGLNGSDYTSTFDMIKKLNPQADSKQLAGMLGQQVMTDAATKQQQDAINAETTKQKLVDAKVAMALQSQAKDFFAPFETNLISSSKAEADLLGQLANNVPPEFQGVFKNQAAQALTQGNRLADAYALQGAMAPLAQYQSLSAARQNAQLDLAQRQAGVNAQSGGGSTSIADILSSGNLTGGAATPAAGVGGVTSPTVGPTTAGQTANSGYAPFLLGQ